MKAVITAGGKGVGLRPLTCNKPKPLLPVLNKPIMEHLLQHLAAQGFLEIAVTLQYLPELIKGFFGEGQLYGLRLYYLEEISPLGTAGGIKNAESFLDQTFLVIPGDNLVDFDFQAALDFHRARGALATLILAGAGAGAGAGRGVVVDQDGLVLDLEASRESGRERIAPNFISTGIYIFQPEVLQYFPREAIFDLQADLLPLLLREKRPVYGFPAGGYWCDIGELLQYRQANRDFLNGRVKLPVSGRQVLPGVWVGENTEIHPAAELKAPVYLGSNCYLEQNVCLDGFCIIGNNTIIKSDSFLKDSIIWNNVYLDQGVQLKGATIADHVRIKARAVVHEDAVIGYDSVIGQRSVIQPGVRVWPSKVIEDNVSVCSSLVWGQRMGKSLFGLFGIKGLMNVEITADFAAKLAAAYGSSLRAGAKVVVGADGHQFSQILKRVFTAGLVGTGARVVDLGQVTTPITRYAVKSLGADGGVHIRQGRPAPTNEVVIEFFDRNGINIDRSMERKIENTFRQEDFHRAGPDQIGEITFFPQLPEAYQQALLRLADIDLIRRRRFKIVVGYEDPALAMLVTPLLEKLGCQVVALHWMPGSREEDLAQVVGRTQAHLGAGLDSNTEVLTLVTEEGKAVGDELLLALVALIYLAGERAATLGVPVTAPDVLEHLAGESEGQVIRTKVNPRALMEVTSGVFQPLFDAVYLLVLVLDYLARKGCTLSEVVRLVPPFHIHKESVFCPWEEKGKVMRKLVEEAREQRAEMIDGVKIFHEYGWVVVLPDADEPVCRVVAEAQSQKLAEEMAASYVLKIKQILESA